jgi:ATP-dependent exoDNAse (exonuclease V) alpha subunit
MYPLRSQRNDKSVEAIEKRPDSQLARSIVLALPTEIDDRTKIKLVREFVRENFVDRGMIADLNLHQLDSDNPRDYILLTMWNLSVTTTGEVRFGNKNRTWKGNSSDSFVDRAAIDRSIEIF